MTLRTLGFLERDVSLGRVMSLVGELRRENRNVRESLFLGASSRWKFTQYEIGAID